MEAFRKSVIQLETIKQGLEEQARKEHRHYDSAIQDKDKTIKTLSDSFKEFRAQNEATIDKLKARLSGKDNEIQSGYETRRQLED